MRFFVRDRELQAEYDRGYRDAIEMILTLPKKVFLGPTTILTAKDEHISNCSFVAGSDGTAVRINYYGSNERR